MATLTLPDLVAQLRGEQPLPENKCASYSLPISAAQLAELVPLLQENEQLRGLKLRGCRLDCAAAQEISRAIAFNQSLRHLDLRDNVIRGPGASYLANALRNYNFHLQSLDLSGGLRAVCR